MFENLCKKLIYRFKGIRKIGFSCLESDYNEQLNMLLNKKNP